MPALKMSAGFGQNVQFILKGDTCLRLQARRERLANVAAKLGELEGEVGAVCVLWKEGTTLCKQNYVVSHLYRTLKA
jgi:hypothetical protein